MMLNVREGLSQNGQPRPETCLSAVRGNQVWHLIHKHLAAFATVAHPSQRHLCDHNLRTQQSTQEQERKRHENQQQTLALEIRRTQSSQTRTAGLEGYRRGRGECPIRRAGLLLCVGSLSRNVVPAILVGLLCIRGKSPAR